MGVHGLWQLLQPAGRPVSLESLEGKVLAVDVSIWLHQTMKGMRDKDGNPLPNAHLQGLFSRVCKLLFYRIKPVFVFDGGVPVLKKKTLAARRDRREEAERESTAVAEKLLQNLVKSQAVKQALGDGGRLVPVSGASTTSKPGRVPGVRKGRNQKDIDLFQLAPLPESEEMSLIKETEDWEKDFEKQENWIKEGLATLSDTHPDADEFKSLPAEIQHEILREVKESKKYHTLRHLTQMPEDSEDFSSYQLKRLMKQCRLTTRMEEIRREMSSQTAQDLASTLSSQYAGEECGSVRSQFGDQVEARRIVSEDASHYVLIKGISSDGQMRQADKYHLEQTVKIEDVESDADESGPRGSSNARGRESSPDKKSPLKASVKIISTDDSDSDVETVVARRMRRKGPGKRPAKRPRTGLERKKITAAMRVKESDGASKQSSKGMSPSHRVSNSSSEDEGFIEVTVDPDAPLQEDELFPASMFETAAQANDNGEAIVGKNMTATSTATIVVDEDQNLTKYRKEHQLSSNLSQKDSYRLSSRKGRDNFGEKNNDIQVLSGNEAFAPRDKRSAEADKDKRRELLSIPEVRSEKIFKSSSSHLVEAKKDAEKPVSQPGNVMTKRKSVLSDILGQLQEKKKKLNEEIEEISGEDMSLPGTAGEEAAILKSVRDGEAKRLSQTDDEAAATGGGFVPEGSSDSDDGEHTSSFSRQKKQDFTSAFVADESFQSSNILRQRVSSESSVSDEDLKLAKELSLQTDAGHSREDRDAELDEDLKLAIKLSLEVSKPDTMGGKAKGENKKGERSVATSGYPSVDAEESSSPEEDFEEVAEAHHNTVQHFDKTKDRGEKRDDSPDSEDDLQYNGGVLETDGEGNGPERPQPEDFEVDDETESRAYVPALSEHDLHDMREELESERSVLLSQQGRQNRMAASVTEQTNLDAQDLLRLFGVPYIVSPLEAEAQCAFLEAEGLTEGTITDDSDFWLFGGQRMYKNFFNQSKHVELYTMDNIHNHFSLTREQLINIALLCGSDYTEGLQGVGPVRALEIMAEFPGSGLEGLYKFRQWWDRATQKHGAVVVGNKIRARLKNLSLIPGFPSEAVVDAYMNPTVDESSERFSWATPELDMLRDFCKSRFGWAKEKSDQTLEPMFKAWSKTQSQGRISSYFGPEAFVQTSKIKSDRLRKALEMVKNPVAGSQRAEEKASDRTTGARKQNKKAVKAKVVEEKSKQTENLSANGESVQERGEGTSSDSGDKVKRKKATGKHVSFESDAGESKKSDNIVGEFAGDAEKANVRGSGDDDFMSSMSEKVKRAKADLEKMEQARDFACVTERVAKPERGKGRAAGKNRGRGKGKSEGGSIPVSLDSARKSSRSQRGRSARGGRGTSRKSLGTVNLSESSSSSSDDDEEDDGESDKNVVIVPQHVEIGKGNRPRKPPSSSKTPGSEKLKSDPVNSRKQNRDEANTTGTTRLKPEDESMDKNMSTTSRSKTNPDLVHWNDDLRDSHLVSSKESLGEDQQSRDGAKEMRNEDDNLTNVSKAKQVEQPCLKGNRSTSSRVPIQATKSTDVKKVEKLEAKVTPKREARKKSTDIAFDGEKQSTDKEAQKKSRNVVFDGEKQSTDKEAEKKPRDVVFDGEKQSTDREAHKKPRDVVFDRERQSSTDRVTGVGQEQDEATEAVDISKADVSLINKRNLPATLAYLNQRSKQDKMLLNQISRRRMRNAVELRMEQEEKRPVLERPNKTKEVAEGAGKREDQVVGLSFEDALGGIDTEDGVSPRAKKKKLGQSELLRKSKMQDGKTVKKTWGDKSGSVPSSFTSNEDEERFTRTRAKKTGDHKKLSSSVSQQSGKSGVSMSKSGEKSVERDEFRKRSTYKSTAEKAHFINDNDNCVDSEIVKRVNRFGSITTPLPVIEAEYDGSVKELGIEVTAERGKERKENPEDVELSSLLTQMNKSKQKREEERSKLKSKRSRAFDRPIREEVSDEDEDLLGSPRSSFQKQLEHLHESKSVKGHGPLYTSSAGPDFHPFQEKGRAYAGKGKGRGKNRTAKYESTQGGGFVTEKERKECESLTVEDLGSDFSDVDF